MMRILVGDIDARQTVFSLFEGEDTGQLSLSSTHTYENQQFSGVVSMVGDFMHGARVDAAAFAVAGSVHRGVWKDSDLGWITREAELSPILGTSHCVLLNEVQAAALGVLESPRENWAFLQEVVPQTDAPRAVVSVGSTFGRALWVPPDVSLPSEAGLVGFAPRNAIERRFVGYLAERVEEVSLQQVLSDQGLLRLHDFLIHEGLAAGTALAEIERAADPATELARLGSRDLDRACAATVASFADILGAQLSNVALSYLPRGGLFLIGSLARSLRSVFEQGHLLDAFLDRPVLHDLLESIPLVLVDDPRLPTLGAKRAAALTLGSQRGPSLSASS